MVSYHDREWGVPVHDDRTLFEFLILEGAQAGLSWETILRKRDRYRTVFANFEWQKVARFSNERVLRILSDPGIVRNRLKVRAAVTNAHCFEAVRREHETFDRYVWSFVSFAPLQHRRVRTRSTPSRTAVSDALSADLKRRGFRFTGSTICYAFMQAAGLTNDHERDCFRYEALHP
ncbi:MAG: DNA-3-methyladenine glycosylase I [Vulcanimicrobiaceae bacterium]